MTYHFEQLTPEDFQRLCQSILSLQFPNAQLLPVGQPDGGRDAFVLHQARASGEQEYIVFQVKFSRDPSSKSEREAVLDLIETEGKKVSELVKRGVTKYYFLTNVAGTSHLEVGAIDRANALLANSFGVESRCWWRDDLARRVDTSSSLKWSYPAVLRATDLLEALVGGMADDRLRKCSLTLQRYMTHQYIKDAQLKFKQIELQKTILQQFVDVPARIVIPSDERGRNRWLKRADERASRHFSGDGSRELILRLWGPEGVQSDGTGATQLLSQTSFAHSFSRIVIEGAPGQGKSTVTQYLCQLHRMALLQRDADKVLVPEEHRPKEARVPFRIDLRDYASWILGRDPFSDNPDARLSSETNPTLEAFIAAQVARYTGSDFTPDDFALVCSRSQTLIVLDGFDEVAEVPTRNRLVSEITEAAGRIEATALALQLIVTSRPAAFANSPGFSPDDFQHIQLLSLTEEIIELFTKKWLDSRDADLRERREVTGVMREKLRQPHVRELARNPMQLAILLALISTQGSSLPDKRTALYDKYMDVFFSREADKSEVVRKHRERLIRIHRYIAYRLHAEAEHSGKAGSISETQLKDVIREYLLRASVNTDIVNVLFTGLQERVGALVSRVQGTFEFEVQPLREYFAARYLYDTAPYSPAGVDKRGALPERFLAIARNPYWLNVTRFYAGCYSSGELASLVDGIELLEADEEYKCTLHLQKLIVYLLSDYIFDHNPRLASRLISLVIGEPHFSILVASQSAHLRETELNLPQELGAREAVEACKVKLIKPLPPENRYSLGRLLSENAPEGEIKEIWAELPLRQHDVGSWLVLGGQIGVLEAFDAAEGASLVENYGVDACLALLRFGSTESVRSESRLPQYVLQGMLDGHLLSYVSLRRADEVGRDIYALSVLYALLFIIVGPEFKKAEPDKTISEVLHQFMPLFGRMPPQSLSTEINEIAGDLWPPNFLVALGDLLRTRVDDLRSSYALWNAIIEELRESTGERFGVFRLGFTALSTTDVPHIGSCSLVDVSRPLLERLGYAKAGNPDLSWWLGQLQDAQRSDELYVRLFYTTMFEWLALDQILAISPQLSVAVDSMPYAGWSVLADTVRFHARRRGKGRTQRDIQAILPADMSIRLASMITGGSNRRVSDACFERYLRYYDGGDAQVIENCLGVVVRRCEDDNRFWPEALSWFKRAFHLGISTAQFDRARRHDKFVMPHDVAREICRSAEEYSAYLVDRAESIVAAKMTAVSVASIAERDQWAFEG